MKTKLFTLVLALVASVGTIFADGVQIGDLFYNLNNANQTAQVTRGTYYSGLVTAVIPETVTHNSITYSVTSIGLWAFSCCFGLTSVTIPNSVISIGDAAFAGCTALTSLEIPNNVAYIGQGAFMEVPNVVYFGEATGSPWDARSVNGYVEGWLVYSDATKTNLLACSSEATGTLEIPNTVTNIRDSVFYYCASLINVTIPNGVTSIGQHAFWRVPNIAYYGEATGSPWGARNVNGYVEGWLVYDDAAKTNLLACSTAVTGTLEIPNTVTNIRDSVFYDCTGLTSVTLPSSVTSIEKNAFSGCTNLTSVILNSNTIVSKTYQSGSDNLKSIFGNQVTKYIIGDSVTSIGPNAFCSCTGLTSVTIGNSVTTIGYDAFYGCTSLTSVTIGNSVESIGSDAFYRCTSLTSVIIPNSVTSIGQYAFGSCTGLTSVIIPNSVTSIGWGAFKNCTGLTSVTIGNSVESIGSDAFYGCTGLTSIEIPNSVTNLGGSAFKGCTGLTSVTIGNSVESIDSGDFGAFAGCTNIISVTINSNDVLANGVPSGVEGQELCSIFGEQVGEYIIGEGVTEIGRLMFAGVQISEIHLPHSLKKIGERAFESTNLTSITIPNQVSLIERGAFNRCNHLRSLEILDGETDLTLHEFSDCDSLNSIILPKRLKNISGEGGLPISYSGDIYYNGSFKDWWEKTWSLSSSWVSHYFFLYINNKKVTELIIPDYITTTEAFEGVEGISTIVCYAETPPDNSSFIGGNIDDPTPVYVPMGSVNAYKNSYYWGLIGYYNILPIGQENTDVTETTVVPNDNTADILWSIIANAATYELVIKDKDGNIICTLTFNTNGELINMVLSSAPGLKRATHTQQTSNFSCTITDLNQNTQYTYTMTTKDMDGDVIDVQSGTFSLASSTQHTIKFVNYDGTVLQSGKWNTGIVPTYTGATPTKPSTPQNTYTFKGWSPEIVPVTSDATYTATYTSTLRKYTITFKDKDGSVLCSEQWNYGTMPSCEEPTKAEDEQYTYSFIGWNPAVVAVSADAEYWATYTATPKPTTSIPSTIDNGQSPTKVIRNGQLFILHGDELFNAQGARIK